MSTGISSSGSSSLPLDGIRVVALEQAVSAPFATRQLTDMGARVIKVERVPEGDFARYYDAEVRGMASHFVWVDRNKESIALDFKASAGRELLDRLIATADVVVQNFAPGFAEALGLDAASLVEQHPRLIAVDLSGYGAGGPYEPRRAYDLIVQAESASIATNAAATGARRGFAVRDRYGPYRAPRRCAGHLRGGPRNADRRWRAGTARRRWHRLRPGQPPRGGPRPPAARRPRPLAGATSIRRSSRALVAPAAGLPGLGAAHGPGARCRGEHRDDPGRVGTGPSCDRPSDRRRCGRRTHGGAGYMRVVAVERFYRDARLFRFYEGTSQIQQLVIARQLLAAHPKES